MKFNLSAWWAVVRLMRKREKRTGPICRRPKCKRRCLEGNVLCGKACQVEERKRHMSIETGLINNHYHGPKR